MALVGGNRRQFSLIMVGLVDEGFVVGIDVVVFVYDC